MAELSPLGIGLSRILWLASDRESTLLAIILLKPLPLPVLQPLLLSAKLSENRGCAVGVALSPALVGATVGVLRLVIVLLLDLVKKKMPPPTSRRSRTITPMIKPTFGPFLD